MGDELHVKVCEISPLIGKFYHDFGSLVLKDAGDFYIYVDEYVKEVKEIDKIFSDHINKSKDAWEKRQKQGWSDEKLLENWKANEKLRQDNYTNSLKEIRKNYKDVNWVWIVARNKIEVKDLNHNDSFTKGIENEKIKLNFPKVLEGGGMAYLEAFHEKESPIGKKPFGLFVQALGTPKILDIEWTDFNYNSLKGKTVNFGSEVLLHVYTESLFGEEIEVLLYDHDLIDLNDKLTIGTSDRFTREVDIFETKSFEVKKQNVSHSINNEKENNASYIQKVEIQVKIDRVWEALAGSNLEIFPSIRILKSEKIFTEYPKNYLKVSDKGEDYDTPQEITNNPILVGNIETNIARFHPCTYTELLINYKEKEANKSIYLFKEVAGFRGSNILNFGIIVGSTPKDFSLNVNDNIVTDDCRYHGKPNDHAKNIFSYDKTKIPTNVRIIENNPKEIKAQASFDFGLLDLPSYFWIGKSNKKVVKNFVVKASSCRYQHTIDVMIVPDIEWTINFLYNTPDPVWYGQSSPTYDLYGTQSTAVRDNTTIGDIRRPQDRVALADLIREQNNNNANVSGGGKKIATVANRYLGDVKSNFGLSVKATFDNGKSQELSWKFSEKYRKMLAVLKKIYDLVDTIAGAKNARSASETLPPALAGRRSLMSLSLLPPAPSAGIGWKYINNSNNNLSIELAGRVKCTPLIGGDLRIDLLALADKIPVYGKLITALDLTTWLLEKISLNTLSINYRIDLTFSAKLDLDEAAIKYQQDCVTEESKLDLNLNVSGTFSGKLELEMGLSLSSKQINKFPEVDLQTGVRADCSFKITPKKGTEKDQSLEWDTKFSGLLVVVYYKFSMKRNSKNKPPETLDPFKLIPSYTGTPLNMKFGGN